MKKKAKKKLKKQEKRLLKEMNKWTRYSKDKLGSFIEYITKDIDKAENKLAVEKYIRSKKEFNLKKVTVEYLKYIKDYIGTNALKNVKALYNTGVNIEEFLKYFNIDRAYLDVWSHWDSKGRLILENGELVEINYNYVLGSTVYYRGEVIFN